MNHWLVRFGIPMDISSDRGSQFTSRLWTALTNQLGIQLYHSTAYHPCSNGLVERFHRHLKTSLKARLTSANWLDELPWVLLGIRTAPKEDLQASSAELVYGAPLSVPGDSLATPTMSLSPTRYLQCLRDVVNSFTPAPTTTHGTPPVSVPASLHAAKFVFVRRALFSVTVAI